MSSEELQRNVLPIPDPARTGLMLYDAKDPGNKYPAIRQFASARGGAKRSDRAN